MGKLLILICYSLVLVLPAKSVEAVNPITTTENPFDVITPETVKLLIHLSPKDFEKLTGTHLGFKDKITFKLLKWKLRKGMASSQVEEGNGKYKKMARTAMIFGIGAFLFLLLPFGSFLSIPSAILAVVLGGSSVNKVEKKTNAVLGIVLGSAFLFLLIIAVALLAGFFSNNWH